MRDVRLGLRLMRGAGRAGFLRVALMIGGIAVGVACLAGALQAPLLVTAQSHREQLRAPVPETPATARARRDPLFTVSYGYWGSAPLTVVYVAVGSGTADRPAPGIASLPRPGQSYVSPALSALIRETPEAAARVPGREVGLVAQAGLSSPNELYAYVGVVPGSLTSASGLARFGAAYAPPSLLEPSDIALLQFLLCGAVILPLLIFLAICVRLSAATRARRLAALRLVGMSARRVRVVNAVESLVASITGAVLGLGLYCAADYVLAPIGLPALSWFPGDMLPGAWTVFACVVGVPFVAWQISKIGAREALRDPLAVRRHAPGRSPSGLRIVPVAGGAALMGGVVLAAATARTGTSSHFPTVVIPVGVLACGIGAILAFPLVSHGLAGFLARRGQRPAVLLGARRAQHEPGSANRAVALLVLLVFSSALTVGFAQQAQNIMWPKVAVQEYELDGESGSATVAADLAPIRGITAADYIMASTPDERPGPTPPDPAEIYKYGSEGAFVGSCADLAEFTAKPVTGCIDGRIEQLSLGSARVGLTPQGQTVTFAMTSGAPRTFTVPAAVVQVQPGDTGASQLDGVALIIPPAQLGGSVAVNGQWAVASAPDSGTVQRVLNALQAAFPAQQPSLVGVDLEGVRKSAVEAGLVALGLAVGGLIAVLAYVIAVADRAMERRQNVAVLTLLGVRRTVLRGSQVLEMGLPVLGGMAIALVVGLLSARAYQIVGNFGTTWSWGPTGIVAIACVVAAALALVAGLPLAGRRIDPSLIRRD